MKLACPTFEQLRDFLDSDPGDVQFSPFSVHIETCSQCQLNLDRLTEIEPGISVSANNHSPAEICRLKIDLAAAHPEREILRSPIRFPGPPDSQSPLGRLKQYSIVERIAAGSQGVLFKAYDNNLHRFVAIKVLHSELAASPEAIQRFQREARAVAAVDNQHIVRVHEIGCEPGFPPYLVLDYVAGHSLRERLDHGRIPFTEVTRIVRETAIGLAAAHLAGLVHRDIKPSNLLLTDGEGLVRIADFGLALDQEDTRDLTRVGTLAGTPAYMSPEQVSQPRSVDAGTDIYSLGVVLYELLTGEVPFRGSIRMTLVQVANDEPRLPRAMNDQIPRDLETICLRAIAKQRAGRFHSAQEMADELLRWERGEPILSRPISHWERRWNWCRRNPLTTALSALSVFLLVTITIISIAAAISIAGKSAETARYAAAAADQRNSALATLQALIALQAQFDQEEIDLDELQRASLQIAVDGLEHVRKLSRDPERGGLQSVVALRRMGEILNRLDHVPEARECLLSAEAAARQLLADIQPKPALFQELIAVLAARNELETIASDTPEPRDWLADAIAEARRLRQTYPGTDSDLRLADCLLDHAREHLAIVEEESLNPITDRLLEARQLFQMHLPAAFVLESSPEPGPDSLLGWLESTDLLSQAYLLEADDRSARGLIEEGLGKFITPAARAVPDMPLIRLELAMRFRLVQICRGLAEREVVRREMGLIEKLLERLAIVGVRDPRRFAEVLELHKSIGADRDDEGDLESILFFAEQRRKLIEARLAEVPHDEFALLAAAECWADLADDYWLDGKPKEKTRAAFAQSLSHYRNLAPHAGFEEHDRANFLEVLLAAVEFELECESELAEGLWREATILRNQLQPPFETVSQDWLNEMDERLQTLAPHLR